MNIYEIQETIIEEFSGLDDWLDKYEYLIKMGKTMDHSDENLRSDQYLIPGCQSNLWLKAELKDDKLVIEADSEASITRGIIALVLRVLNHQKPEDILNADLYFIDRIGLRSNLSPSRSDGLSSLIKAIKERAESVHVS